MMFNRLLNLYTKERIPNRTPLEDFITELWAGILLENNDLRQSFVDNMLKIKGANFSVETQKIYQYQGNKFIIDMVFENAESICFVENKVNSDEGYRIIQTEDGEKQEYQLKNYDVILNNHPSLSHKKKYLRYCTKNYDIKLDESYKSDFSCLRWFEISDFIQKQNSYSSNYLLNIFTQFLKHHQMSRQIRFEEENIIQRVALIQDSRDLLISMSNVISDIVPIAKSVLGKKRIEHNDLNQIITYNRLILYKQTVLPDSYSDICVGFSLEDAKLSLTFCVINSKHYAQFESLKMIIGGKYTLKEFKWKSFDAFWITFDEKEMNGFTSESEMVSWFRITIGRFGQFSKEISDQNPEIKWKFD